MGGGAGAAAAAAACLCSLPFLLGTLRPPEHILTVAISRLPCHLHGCHLNAFRVSFILSASPVKGAVTPARKEELH